MPGNLEEKPKTKINVQVSDKYTPNTEILNISEDGQDKVRFVF